jgi:mono/diheme cytochrome c family protein
MANGCLYCHSGYTRPQDVNNGVSYLYPRVSLPGDFATSDESPNNFGTARIGPDLSQEGGFHPDDWQLAHYFDPRFVEPDSIMPDFKFLSNQEVNDLVAYVQLRSGKSGLLRVAGQEYLKRIFLVSLNATPSPTGFNAADLTLAQVALEASNAPSPPNGGYGPLGWPDPINLNYVDRSYWLVSNPLPVTTDNLMRGRFVFQERCIGCHGQGGSAVSQAAAFLSPAPINFTKPTDASGETGNDTSPGDLYYRVLRGIDGSAMHNFGTRLRVDDIWKVVMFLKTIPNGGLLPNKTPTPDMYIQWRPNPNVLAYVKLHPIADNKDFTAVPEPSKVKDPFMLQAQRELAGLSTTDTMMLPGYGEVSLDAAARDIKAIYEKRLDEAWADYKARGGTPVPPASQKDALPEIYEELR